MFIQMNSKNISSCFALTEHTDILLIDPNVLTDVTPQYSKDTLPYIQHIH